MNKYKVAETIVSQIVSDLRDRLGSDGRCDLEDEGKNQEIVDRWEDIVISVLEQTQQQAQQHQQQAAV
jgi:hypothetical protein